MNPLGPIAALQALMPIELTAKATVSGRIYYAWEQRERNYTTGDFQAPISPLRGTTTVAPAREVNNADVPTGTIVLARQAGSVGGQVCYEFQYEPGGSAPTPVYGESTLSLYTITADFTWFDSTLSISLPSAGTYSLECTATARGGVSVVGATSYIAARLWDVTNNSDLNPADPSIAFLIQPQTTVAVVRATTTFGFNHTAAGAKTIRLEVFRGPNFGTSIIDGYSNSSVTRLRYWKIS
ncbi:hypothetical protein J8F10_14430 [Gemmata sp. G18]|uniref:Minor tail protein n=1 Tax=Gemmata palustris TaxID=2822762 RepID=A0ABS5BRW6_9BACT|nr:hypothetical protein [Gemmata palustris]MBP3956474.1 hypothetical protein [Gemmata palustris]